MASKGQRFRHYSIEEKMKIIKEAVEEGKSLRQLSEEYQINIETIKTWVYQYKKGNRMDKPRGRPKESGTIDYKQRYEILKGFLAFLDKQTKTR